MIRLTRAMWDELDQPITGRRVPGTVPVFVLGVFVALVTAAFIVPGGFNLAYSDAQSHLTIARRLLDTSSTPGLQQLGTVWLPVPHLLLAPLVTSLWSWHTGWGAALLGALCLGATSTGLYRAAARWGAGRWARLTAVGVVISNPTLLYLCCTALTEPVLIAAMAMCLAGLANYATRARLSSPGEAAIFGGIPAALAALSRYEGWALCVTGAAFVAVVAWRRTRRLRPGVMAVLGFLSPPALAMAWWIGYNWVVFHNPLEFFNGQFSANAQQTDIVAQGASTKASLGASLRALNESVCSSVGLGAIAVATIGVLTLIIGRRSLVGVFFVATAATSYLFLVVALYTGQAVIWNRAVGGEYVWNNRFGMATILPVSLLAAAGAQAVMGLIRRAAVSRTPQRILRGLTVGALVLVMGGQAAWFMQRPSQRSLVIAEAAAAWANGAPSREAAAWLASHYDGGRILLDETGSDNAHLPEIAIPLREFYLQADGVLFHRAVADPATHVRWVWVSASGADALAQVVTSAPFNRTYEKAFDNGRIRIYQRVGR